MGGCSYDRDVYGSSSGWGGGYSSTASSVLSANSLCDEMKPLNKIIKSKSKNPILIFLDVTGSNTDFAKIVYDKMPMFFGQIEQKGYLKDFEISVCAVGDAHSDSYPLQVADFAKGKEIDDWLEKLVLEGCGGGQRRETYELAAFYALHNFEFEPDAKPIVFFLGDEAPYEKVSKTHIKSYVSGKMNTKDMDVESSTIFKALLDKIPNTYMFLNPYNGYINDESIKNDWKTLFKGKSEQVIIMQKGNEKAIVDLMLGVISMIADRDLNDYKIDMLDRGQTQARIDSVDHMLSNLSKSLVPSKSVNGLVNRTSSTTKRNKNTRL